MQQYWSLGSAEKAPGVRMRQRSCMLAWCALGTTLFGGLHSAHAQDGGLQTRPASDQSRQTSAGTGQARGVRPDGWAGLARFKTLEVAVWPAHVAAVAPKTEETGRWRTSFGAERRSDPLRRLRMAQVAADVIAVVGMPSLKQLRRVFPTRHYFVITSAKARNALLAAPRNSRVRNRPQAASERSQPPSALAAIAIRRRSGLRVTRVTGPRSLGARADVVAARLVKAGRIFWLIVFDPGAPATGNKPACEDGQRVCNPSFDLAAWTKQLQPPRVDIVTVQVSRGQLRPTTTVSRFLRILSDDAANSDGKTGSDDDCDRKAFRISVATAGTRSPQWAQKINWIKAPAAGGCIAKLAATLPPVPRRPLPPELRNGAESAGDGGAPSDP